jgi:hypothetical protein
MVFQNEAKIRMPRTPIIRICRTSDGSPRLYGRDLIRAVQSKVYGWAERLAWVTKSLRSQTFGTLAGFVRHAPD